MGLPDLLANGVHVIKIPSHPATQTWFQMAEKNCEQNGEIGVNNEVLRLRVRPRGAGMVIDLSSFLARTGLKAKPRGFNRKLLYSQDSEFRFRLAMITGV